MSATGSLSSTAPTIPSKLPDIAYPVLWGVSFSHLLNDMMQSLLLAIYPLLKGNLQLSFGQIGLISLVYLLTASVLQPVIGLYTDRHPQPYSLPVGMGFTFVGLVLLSGATSLGMVLVAASLVGIGSSVFHPESSRVARLASGGQHGLALSIFQVGGNLGSSLGPLLAALVIVPLGQGSLAWFSVAALVAMAVLTQVSRWYARHLSRQKAKATVAPYAEGLSGKRVAGSMGVLMLLVFSKYFYTASLSNYLTFYLIDKFQLSVQSAQLYLFAFLFAVAVGTVVGGPLGDRIGRKQVIWGSILGAAPFTLLLPHANLFWTGVLVVIIGLIIASAFSAILVFAQDLMPGRLGAVSGLFFGFAFGMGGLAAAILGYWADSHGLATVYQICAFLPLLGMVAALLPDLRKKVHK